MHRHNLALFFLSDLNLPNPLFPGKKDTVETPSERDAKETSLTSSALNKDKEPDLPKSVVDDRSSVNQSDGMVIDDSGSDGSDVLKGRPMSPGTLALMCDEQDPMFTEAATPNGTLGNGNNTAPQLPYEQGKSNIYEEQERVILTGFRDYLRRLVTCGTIKGKLLCDHAVAVSFFMMIYK